MERRLTAWRCNLVSPPQSQEGVLAFCSAVTCEEGQRQPPWHQAFGELDPRLLIKLLTLLYVSWGSMDTWELTNHNYSAEDPH